MSNHTPGPWTFEEDGGNSGEPLIRGADGNIVAEVYPYQGPDYREPLDEFETNAALIASAPDLLRERDEYKRERDSLLAALKEMVANFGLTPEWDQSYYSRALAAIAKAGGAK